MSEVYADRERCFQLALLSLESSGIIPTKDDINIHFIGTRKMWMSHCTLRINMKQFQMIMCKMEMWKHTWSISDVIRWTWWGARHLLICFDIVEEVNKSLIVYSLLLYWNVMCFLESRKNHIRGTCKGSFLFWKPKSSGVCMKINFYLEI